MVVGFSSGFDQRYSSFLNIAATNSAMLDWTLDSHPALSSNPSDGEQQQQQQTSPRTLDSSHVPIILRYSFQTLATLKPPNLCDLIEEAALEFHLDPKSIYLAILINQCPVKISLSLYRRIAPLSTIHVQLNTPCPIFATLPPHSEAIPCSDLNIITGSNSTHNTPATAPTASCTTTTAAASCNSTQSQNEQQVISDLLSHFTAVSTNPFFAPVDVPLTGCSSPPPIVSLLSPASINGLDSLHLSKEKEKEAAPFRPSSSSTTSSAAAPPAGPSASAVASGSTSTTHLNQTTATKTSKKRFLINSLANTNTSHHHHPHQPHQQPHHQQQRARKTYGQEQEAHEGRRTKFPFLAKRQAASQGSPSSTTGMSITDSSDPDHSPRPSATITHHPVSNVHPSSDLLSPDLFK
ncbi:hypothetical protein VP01_97g5 [Puccinia sorghi]|uniref:Uncharacterized protein n=1 Tax=Puccinia sorghi TaxID=27349 RepID=A0A0L6U5S1_9BASI|nr:hypothetical protein VP01_97g5 [Puccinia sorghi]